MNKKTCAICFVKKSKISFDKKYFQQRKKSANQLFNSFNLLIICKQIMQFGLMIFFLPAFPLAAVFSLLNNMIEVRSDAFKMCLLFQRPFGQRVANIGNWQKVLEVFSILGIIVNCGLLVTFDKLGHRSIQIEIKLKFLNL